MGRIREGSHVVVANGMDGLWFTPPGEEFIVVTTEDYIVTRDCGCEVALGTRMDTHEPYAAIASCGPNHADTMSMLYARYKTSLTDPHLKAVYNDRPALDVLRQFFDEAFDAR